MTHPTSGAGALIGRSAAIGAGVLGLVGGIIGLVVGLNANPRTAWFAVFEIGIPAAILGGLVGLLSGVLVSIGRHLDRKSAARETIDA